MDDKFYLEMELPAEAGDIHNWMGAESAIATVFFPRKLPMKEDTTFSQGGFGRNSGLFHSFADINKTILPRPILKMLELWHQSYALKVDELELVWSCLKEGDTFPVHLFAQNAALTFSKRGDGMVLVRGFNVQPTYAEVTTSGGCLIGTYPSISVVAPKDQVFCTTMAKQLVDLQSHMLAGKLLKTLPESAPQSEGVDEISSDYVFQWLFGVLLAVGKVDATTKTVVKKVRDIILCDVGAKRQSQPWRRLPGWLAFKSVLYVTLVNDKGEATGRLLYKTAMLQYMAAFFRFKKKECLENHDQAKQMLAKIARRARKLTLLVDHHQSDTPLKLLKSSVDGVINSATRLVLSCSESLDAVGQSLARSLIPVLPHTPANCDQKECCLPLESAAKKIQALRQFNSTRSNTKKNAGEMEVHAGRDDLRNLLKPPYSREANLIGLHDYEQSILEQYLAKNPINVSCTEILSQLKLYEYASSKLYPKSDAIGQSRRLLVGAVLVTFLDMFVVKEFPLLKDHCPDVNYFRQLDVVLASDSMILHVIRGIELYFKSRQSSAACDSPLRESVTAESLSVRFVEHSKEMQQLLVEKLDSEAERKSEYQKKVRAELNKMCQDERNLARRSCEKRYWDDYRDEFIHVRRHCRRCLEDDNMSRKRLPIFVDKFPASDIERKAIVFEAAVPVNISAWRDAIYFYAATYLKAVKVTAKPVSARTKWVQHIGGKVEGNVSLASKHYQGVTEQSVRDKRFEPSAFFTPCTLDCGLSADGIMITSLRPDNHALKEACSFQLSLSSLQSFVTWTNHHQSEVLSRQHECPEVFSCREFVCIGSLRAGQCLQWFNILRGIHSRTLLLHEPDVVQLICQAMWQAGENSSGDWLRNSHRPCGSTAFLKDIIRELDEVVDGVSENWQHHWTLCAVILIANRLHDLYSAYLNQDTENLDKLTKLVLKCRHIASEWLDTLLLILADSDANAAITLQAISARVAAFGALTFTQVAFVANRPESCVPNGDLWYWLRFVTDIHNNRVVNSSTDIDFSSQIFDSVLRVAQTKHSEFLSLLRADKIKGSYWLHKFTKWFCKLEGTLSEMSIHHTKQLWVCFKWNRPCSTDTEGSYIQFDLRQGRSWIDGLTLDHLPDHITSSKLFSRHFQDVVFKVKPCKCPHMNPAQVAEDPSSKGTFIFSLQNNEGKDEISIYERHGDKDLLLLPTELFVSDKEEYLDIPKSILDNHSVWLDINSGIVYFRQIFFRHDDFKDLEKSPYTLNMDTALFTVKAKQPGSLDPGAALLSSCSPMGKALHGMFCRLEMKKYIEVWRTRDGSQVKVILPRLHLSFKKAKASQVVVSDDMNGFSVHDCQSPGTLLGLKHCLLLVQYKGHEVLEQRCLLVPHGPIQLDATARGASSHHQSTVIDLAKLHKSVPYFCYHLNEDLRHLTAQQSRTAWVFLASLHAHTSSVHPDSFTGLTGMELAMHILQSARCWSSQPYDNCTKAAFKSIRKLSPRRSYRPRHKKLKQTAVWPGDLPSLCASDGYVLLVDRMLEESDRLKFLHCIASEATDEDEKMHSDEEIIELNHQSYHLHKASYPLMACLSGEKVFNECNVHASSPEMVSTEANDLVKAVFVSSCCLEQPRAESVEKLLLVRPLDDSKEIEFQPAVDDAALDVCSRWCVMSLPEMFMAVHRYIEKFRSKEKWHLSLMLSFWSYHLRGDEMAPLVHVLAALVNSNDELAIPGCTHFPSSQAKFPVSSELLSEFTHTFKDFAATHFHFDIETQPLYEWSRSRTDEWRIDFRRCEKNFEERKKSLLDAVKTDVEGCKNILLSAPHEYMCDDPKPPLISFAGKLHNNIFRNSCYERRVQECVESINRSSILSAYVQNVCSLSEELPVYDDISPELLPPSVINHLATVGYEGLIQRTIRLKRRKNLATSLKPLPSPLVPSVTNNAKESQSGPSQKATKLLKGIIGFLSAESNGAVARTFASDLEESLDECSLPESSSDGKESEETMSYCKRIFSKSRELQDRYFQDVEESFTNYTKSHRTLESLHRCGLLLRPHPLSLIPLALDHGAPKMMFVALTPSPDFKSLLVNAISSIVRTRHNWRKVFFLEQKQHAWFSREKRNPPHSTWQPQEHLEWLTYELENNLCVWPKQAEVAKRMMYPDNTLSPNRCPAKHAAMQLNMGEGKTSVIMPIIAAELANKSNLVRLIVLTSLYTTNYNQLVFKLGGLLNRRVYSLPFRRDMNLDKQDIDIIYQVLKQCQETGGVLVTVREHVLSLQLKYQESCFKGNIELASSINKVLSLLQCYARDVIDEADEVLHHRFQLIYPIGEAKLPDGESIRWQMAEAVLDAVKNLSENFHEKFSAYTVYEKTPPQNFPYLRLLDTARSGEVYSWLCKKVVDQILSGNSAIVKPSFIKGVNLLETAEKDDVRKYLLHSEATAPDVEGIKRITEPKLIYSHILCLRGLLAREVLFVALKKRYRVEYGLAPKPELQQGCFPQPRHIKMAVPFRAKDVAAERTEFGHTDVAIVLTLLSYYFGGLHDEQIDTVFERLEKEEAKRDIYSSWVTSAESTSSGNSASAHSPGRKDVGAVHESIRELSGVNRKDSSQMVKYVYPFLCHHMGAVNFYLNHVIFPSECKVFDQKLVGNAWTLAPPRHESDMTTSEFVPPVFSANVMTGFSGTNDTRLLLPESVEQKDLKSLKHTNAHVCKLLLQEENNAFFKLPVPCSGKTVIDMLKGCGKTVNTFIDAGALVLDLTNEEFVRSWLEGRKEMRAAVYFDTKNQIYVYDHKAGTSCKLELSSFSNNLSDCLVYLDHSHTRGTDLPMVDGTRAAVTIGKGLKRDDLVQACMRMRRLGNGHSLCFWAQPDVEQTIQDRCKLKKNKPVEHMHILLWCFSNSIEATEQAFYAWATQGLAFLHGKETLLGATRMATMSPNAQEEAVAGYIEKKMPVADSVPLAAMYGRPCATECIHDIIEQLGGDLSCKSSLVQKCYDYVPRMQRFAQRLEEEQEREMEETLEEERSRELPGKVCHIPEEVPDYLNNLVATSRWEAEGSTSIPLWDCLKRTSLAAKRRHGNALDYSLWNKACLKATESFASPVETSHDHPDGDKFLRPAEWVLVVRRPGECTKMLLLSPLQANNLLLQAYSGQWHCTVSLHHYASPARQGQSFMTDCCAPAFGRAMTRLTDCSEHQQMLFTEILCYSGGLFFGTSPKSRAIIVRCLAHLLQLSPTAEEGSNNLVQHIPISDIQPGGEPSSPVVLLRNLLSILRSEDSVELSDMGNLLLRQQWPRKR